MKEMFMCKWVNIESASQGESALTFQNNYVITLKRVLFILPCQRKDVEYTLYTLVNWISDSCL